MNTSISLKIRKFVQNIWESDPLYLLLRWAFRKNAFAAAVFAFITHISIWVGVSTVIGILYPQSDIVFITDLDEFAFGFFLWGIFIPVVWWYYLSCDRMWESTYLSLCNAGVVNEYFNKKVRHINFAIPAVVISLIADYLYNVSSIPAEISLGRLSFWFAADWSRYIILFLVFVNAYIIISFVLKTIYLAYHMRRFFNLHGVRQVRFFYVDESGGLGAVGTLAMRITVLAVLIGFWAAFYSLLPLFAGEKINLSLTVLLIYLAYVILASTTLFSLIWPAHRAMRTYKRRYIQGLSDELENKFASISNLDSEPQVEVKVNIRFDKLSQVYEKAKALPEWPLPKREFRIFSSIASVPGLIGLISLLNDIVDFSMVIGDLFN